jgi:MOSC domain-containing protein YiiM
MKSKRRTGNSGSLARMLGMGVLAASALVVLGLKAQNPEMQQRIAEVKESMAVNKQLLAQYTWMEQDIISIKGEEKKEELYNVQLGPDGKPQKTPVDPSTVSDDDRRRRGLRGRIIEKKTEEYKEYGDQIKSLVRQYVPPEKEMLQQAYQQGNVMMGPMGGAPGEYRLVISNYVKQGDTMTLVMNKAQKAAVSLSISTYLNDPSDAVKVNVQFAKLPNGPNHVASETIDGVSKQLTITVQNSNYQHQ